MKTGTLAINAGGRAGQCEVGSDPFFAEISTEEEKKLRRKGHRARIEKGKVPKQGTR